MQLKGLPIGWKATVAVLIAILCATGTPAVTAQEKQLYAFGSNSTDGAYPHAGLIRDAAGNLYGTTNYGGTSNVGAVSQLAPKAGGTWRETILYSFKANGTDGTYPYAALIFDGAGNLYGTTFFGGPNNCGIVFELTPKAGGGWTEKVLHTFVPSGGDGENPRAGVVFDSSGNLYGTTYLGGVYDNGAVFELMPKASGGWTEKVLHSFGNGKDGALPYAALIIDVAGNLFSTTFNGGAAGLGTVFELTPKAGGKWSERVIHSFNGKDGAYPAASLTSDGSGNLYGTTESAIFELAHKAGGGWTEKVLHDSGSTANLIFDKVGKLYGTTYLGGTYGYGTLFELMPTAGGKWTYLTLYAFTGGGSGAYPYAGLTLGAKDHMYGTTYEGGNYNYGTVFEFTPY